MNQRSSDSLREISLIRLQIALNLAAIQAAYSVSMHIQDVILLIAQQIDGDGKINYHKFLAAYGDLSLKFVLQIQDAVKNTDITLITALGE